MTRDEAIQKVKAVMCPPGAVYWMSPGVVVKDAAHALQREAARHVDIAVALGLKLDEPKTVEQEAAEWLSNMAYSVNRFDEKRARAALVEPWEVVSRLRNGGFKIVKAD